jgi:hypothetical protein
MFDECTKRSVYIIGLQRIRALIASTNDNKPKTNGTTKNHLESMPQCELLTV